MHASAELPLRAKRPSRSRRRLMSPLAVSLALIAGACSGSIKDNPGAPGSPGGSGTPTNPGGPGNPAGPGGAPAAVAPQGVMASVAPLRRLNGDQFRNTIQDLLGLGDLATEAALPPDESISNERFLSNVTRPVQGSDVDRYADLAEAIARKAVANLPPVLGCDAGGSNENGCVESFIAQFGKRAFRRPLTQTEVGRAKALYMTGRSNGGDVANGVRLVIQAMLQSPSFLYLVEPAPGADPGKVVAVDPWAMASRLSYFFLNSMPDGDLFTAAQNGQLATPEQVAQQATRLTGTPRFRDMVANFHSQWLELGELKSADKDAKLFPAWNDQLRAALLEEPRRFVDYVMHDGDGKLETLLTAPYSVLSGPLYDFYGAPKPASTTDWQKTNLDPKQRAGLLTQAGLMASLAKEDRTSFIRRGKLIREGVLCTPVPDPPPGVDASEAMVPATADARQRAAIHRDKPECASCHALFDPLGFAFEGYDAIGRFRTTENGKPINSATEISQTKALDGSVKDAIEMVGKLAQADEVRECVARQWLRFSLGREENNDDAATLGEAMNGFKTNGWKVTDLLLAIARSDSFRYQKVKP
jgi:hypothetical protein